MQFKKFVVLILTAMFVLWGCNEEINTVNKVELSFGISKSTVSLSKTTSSGLDNVSKAIITLKEGGLLKYDQQEVSLVNWGNEGVYRTDLIEVDAGVSYNLTQFELRDENNITLYATPLEGAPLAVNIDDPLPIAVNANKNEQKAIQVEVISTENLTPKDFGYPYFVVKDKTLLPFTVTVKTEGNLTTANLKVTSGSYVYEQALIAGINQIVISGAYTNYEVQITKYGFTEFSGNFSADSLANKHLFLNLSKIDVPVGYVLVEGGSFMMGKNGNFNGDDYADPEHNVTLSTYLIGKYEVTNSEYAQFLNAMGNQTEGTVTWINLAGNDCKISEVDGTFTVDAGYENYPVDFVSWFGAKAYCEWKGGRLPTEAEWEFAAKGGNLSQGYTYSGGNDLDEVSWHYSNSGEMREVGTKKANELGIHDMTGNAYEWCNDWTNTPSVDNYYDVSPVQDPMGPDTGEFKIFRDASASSSSSKYEVFRRGWHYTKNRAKDLGFRVAIPVR
ncbi:MAG: formylglycine-generating enzyme family protein [Rhodothermaceae bacterium]